jgi:acetoin utilization deacetylase AcuC-like enzyme
VERFLSGSLESREIRRIGLEPWTDAFVPRTMRIVGGAVEALAHVTRFGGIAGNMAGGTHHSHRSFGSGYCVFNDLAICALLARDKHGYERIAVLDLDVHQGDGTATILKDEEGIITISVHGEKNFPFRKAVSDHDFPLPNGTGDQGYLHAVKESLAIIDAFSPDILLFQAGVDALEFDALGNLEVSKNGMKIRNDLVFSFLDRRTPCVFFMGGGYSDPIDYTIDAFNDLFEGAAESNALFDSF